jgi:SHS2 domain-containing protein
MPFEFIDDIALADVAVEIHEKTVEALFKTAADALLQVQVEDIDSVNHDVEKTIRVSHPKIDLLLYKFLQELIFLKDAKHLMLRADSVAIEHPKDYTLTAYLSGEKLDTFRHEQKVDVKAVTLHLFKVVKNSTGWKATIVFDI